MPSKLPEILEVNSERMHELVDRASSQMNAEDAELIRRIIESHDYITDLIEDKNTSIRRLRKLLFGAKTEKAKNILNDGQKNSKGSSDSDSNADRNGSNSDGSNSDVTDPADDIHDESDSTNINDDNTASSDAHKESPSSGGHGRLSADDYPGAAQVQLHHPHLNPGDTCPECGRGTLYEKAPAVMVRFVGQAPLGATVYRRQRLRCHLCGEIYTAPAPPEAGDRKYDNTAASMIALLKYGSGLPFNRLGRLQQNCEIPLAASTQWDIVNVAAEKLRPAYDALIRQASQGEVIHNDDTTVRILECMGERARKHPPTDDEMDPDRTGLFTSGVVALRDGIRIALFFSGRKHAGENLADVLAHREAELAPPIHMCDGLNRNVPKEFETILANCIAHSRRKFVDIHDRFSNECSHIIREFAKVYHHDQVARDENMSAAERLTYHQAHSQPVMNQLQQWFKKQFEEKLVEPNSALGEAITYSLKRWQQLTVFLREAGAPLDNNLCERMLKKSILHRKNALFFKTRHGARVGDLYMSLIYTCELAEVNAYDYLNQLQLHATAVAQSAEQWMPWNYLENAINTKAA